MATNARTWFYSEPEHQAYLIEERVNHTFWSNRITSLYLDCTQAEPPFRMEGEWQGLALALEWVPNDYLTLVTQPKETANLLLVGLKEILGFAPTVSFVDSTGQMIVEWHVQPADTRIREIQSNPGYHNIKRYT